MSYKNPEDTKKYQKAYRKANRNKLNEQSRNWNHTHKDQVTAAAKKRRHAKPELSRNQRWKSYGIVNSDGSFFTTADYTRMFEAQEGRCNMCKRHQDDIDRALDVDHSHKTGFARWLLCNYCNIRIMSVVENDNHLIERARELLGRFNEQT